MRRLDFFASGLGLLLAAAACGDDPQPQDAPMASGFAEEESGRASTSSDSTSAGPTGEDPDSGEPWDGTAYLGEVRGLLTLTFTPAHALRDEDVVGMAGGYRTSEVGWADALDLYSPVAYQLAFPPPPSDADTIVPAEPVPVFDWGSTGDWMQAGLGMKLRQGEGEPELLACLLPAGSFPLYRTSAAMGVPAECQPDPTAWAAASGYDVVLYGGELFEDNVLLDRITTPPALAVTAPDLAVFGAQISARDDLTVSWETADDPDTRIIIRVVDGDTNVITAHATDDGEFTIPAAELSALTTGPIDLLIARERTDRVQFTDGGLTVLGRYERWGFFDLF